MSAVAAGDVASSASYANAAVYGRKDFCVTVNFRCGGESLHLLSHNIFQALYASLSHISLKAFLQVVDDSVAIFHDSRADLGVAASKLDEFQGVFPGVYSSDSGQLEVFHNMVLCHFQYEPQGNRLDRLS